LSSLLKKEARNLKLTWARFLYLPKPRKASLAHRCLKKAMPRRETGDEVGVGSDLGGGHFGVGAR
jgi:hypothetical protein